MNKARRHELKMLKYKKRLKKYRLDETKLGPNANLYAFRSHGKPCSCIFCHKGYGYNRAKVKQELA